jgi:Na+-translocating ferredoxin:NAD+ oxidoreductase RNF subunit RnfB
MLPDILTALAVVTSIVALLGSLLAIISYKFSVSENPKKKIIRECLPGINCGACGFKGCDDYADAVADGKATANLCIPGSDGVARQLGEILGVEVPEPKDVVAFVHCNGHCDATGIKGNYDGIASCAAASMVFGGPTACKYGCLGFGDCAAACPANAICIKDSVAHVDTSRCLGCGLCSVTCPKKAISMIPQETVTVVMCNSKDKGADARKACKNACISCKKCENRCEHGAIRVIDNLAIIDYSKCVGCVECVQACPTGCIKTVFFPDIPED